MPEVAAVRAGEEQDWARAEAWIRARMPELPAPLEVLQFPGGHANLTYLLRFGGSARELVLRRPPFGPVAPGAHDMVREHKVLSRLWEYLATGAARVPALRGRVGDRRALLRDGAAHGRRRALRHPGRAARTTRTSRGA